MNTYRSGVNLEKRDQVVFQELLEPGVEFEAYKLSASCWLSFPAHHIVATVADGHSSGDLVSVYARAVVVDVSTMGRG